MRTLLWTLFVVLALAHGTAPKGLAQVGRAAVGGAVGVGGGAVITFSLIVARARFQNEYIETAEDLIDWTSVPLILTPAVWVAFGLAGRDALVGSIVGSTSGMLIGAGLGAATGWIVSPQAEAPWAGGVIGAGVGLTVGGLLLGIRGWLHGDKGEEGNGGGEPVRVGATLPL